MRSLNCKRTARMIALYVGGDLVGVSERKVAAHLESCKACCRLADEFSESRSLLTKACALPEFDAEFYSGIRSAVLGEITRSRRQSRPSLFRSRWLYATSFAALVIACLVMLQHFGSTGRQTPTGLASARPVSGPSTLGQATAPAAPSSPPLAALPRLPRKVHQQIAQAPRPSTSVGPVVRQNATLSRGTASSPSGSGSVSQVSSIEIQTANPNIRIIWLTPRESPESEKSNHDQDPNQNGDRN